jgi:hypothetical protein
MAAPPIVTAIAEPALTIEETIPEEIARAVLQIHLEHLAAPAAGPAHGATLLGPKGGVPGRMKALYVGFGVLQALDAQTTFQALERGGVERNPLLAPLADRPAALIAVKAASTAGTVYLLERLRKRSPRAALVTAAAINAAYVTIVASNAR